jgi:hypothetical protein
MESFYNLLYHHLVNFANKNEFVKVELDCYIHVFKLVEISIRKGENFNVRFIIGYYQKKINTKENGASCLFHHCIGHLNFVKYT